MSEPTPARPLPAAPVLGYVTEQAYTPAGAPGVWAVVLALLAGLVAAAIGAGLALVWMISDLPTWLFLPFVGQGVVVGGVLAWVYRRTKLASPTTAIVIGAVCGVASAAFFNAALYVRNVYHVREDVKRDVAEKYQALGVSPDDPQVKVLHARFDAQPFDLFDRAVLLPQTGRRGFLGYMVLRKDLWALALLQAGTVVAIATWLGRQSASRPFCRNCGGWFNDPVNAAVLPVELADPLALAIESEDTAQVLALHQAHHEAGGELGVSCAVARVHACPKCGQRYADVVVRGYAGAAPKPTLHRVSPEMVQALKWEPDEPAAEPPSQAEARLAAAEDPAESSDRRSGERAAPGPSTGSETVFYNEQARQMPQSQREPHA